MVIKIDLEKAYDRLFRTFIKDSLEKANLPENWSRNIISCVETMKMSLLWNGKRLEWFLIGMNHACISVKFLEFFIAKIHDSQFFSLILC